MLLPCWTQLSDKILLSTAVARLGSNVVLLLCRTQFIKYKYFGMHLKSSLNRLFFFFSFVFRKSEIRHLKPSRTAFVLFVLCWSRASLYKCRTVEALIQQKATGKFDFKFGKRPIQSNGQSSFCFHIYGKIIPFKEAFSAGKELLVRWTNQTPPRWINSFFIFMFVNWFAVV